MLFAFSPPRGSEPARDAGNSVYPNDRGDAFASRLAPTVEVFMQALFIPAWSSGFSLAACRPIVARTLIYRLWMRYS